ncbi:hypothetical protein B0J17DRAFT_737034 [Rhizoctonia solani]|nr:hypothetical protein B0J17DRAFT_737034 [Rhizoctonia solani]
MVVFSDGSCLRSNGHCYTRARYLIIRYDIEVWSVCMALSKKAEVFDTEMYALAGAASLVWTLIASDPNSCPPSIIFCNNNRAAASLIINLSDHSAQLASIIFQCHIDSLLSQYPTLCVEVIWVPAHCRIQGNKRADALACKAIVQHPHPLFHHTITWAHVVAKSKVIKEWNQTLFNSRHLDLVIQAIVRPPSSKLVPAH